MPLTPGSRLGHYEIQSLRGAGGMGEVYRSRDVRLDRIVALKILPSQFAADPEFRQRFEREARSVAALSHPHICALYDVGEAPHPEHQQPQPVQFLVMEYLEGETLAEAIQRKPLTIPDVLRTSIEIADAIDKAHRQGVVHRDLKPGNIMLTASGAKLLDFGLAKVRHPLFSGASMTATVGTPLTDRGTILGTPNYMAPEQVEGREADQRSDIFALGAIIYEMTTGRKAFEGSSPASVMAAILDREPPPPTTLRPLASPLLDHIIARCLAKNPDDRWQSAGDVMRELKWIAQPTTDFIAHSDAKAPPRHRAWLSAIAVWAILSTIAALFSAIRLRQAPAAPEQRLEVTTPATQDPLSLAISPDGEKIAFVATTDGRSQLWLRYLNSVSVQPLRGTEGAQFPFWSPDSRSIGFGASGWLKRIDLDGGAVRTLANAPLFLGGAWTGDGAILFVPNTNTRVFRVPDGGGDPVAVSPIEPGTHAHFPHVLPDGRHYLFYLLGSPAVRGVYMAGVDGTGARRLLDAQASALYAQGRLLFLREGKLLAQRFDPSSGTFDGPITEVVERIASGNFAGATIVAASTSPTGTIAYRSGDTGVTVRTNLKWVDRLGNVIERINGPPGIVINAALAPNGRRFTWFNGTVWLYDLATRTASKFTFSSGVDFGAIWSPDGARIVFGSNRNGVFDLYQKDATGAGSEELLLATSELKVPTDWSQDGKFVLFRSLNPKTTFDIWGVSIADRKAFPIAATPFDERDGQFSPDGKWIAYQSNESGRFEIWVRPFRQPGSSVKADERWQFTNDGGTQVRWSHDGKEIFYVSADGRLMSLPVSIESGGRAPLHAAAVPLFSIGAQPYSGGTALPWYMVSADSKRFLTVSDPPPLTTTPVTVLLNWHPQP